MTGFLRELRLAVRALGRARTFALVAVSVVAVGVGANVLVFSLANALLLRPLPVPDADRLVRVGRATHGARFGAVSYPEYRQLRDSGAAAGAVELVAHYPNSAILTAGDGPRTAWLEVVSANYFAALRLRPALGRGFVPDDERAPRASPVVVLSDGLWRRRFGGDPGVVGRAVRINGHAFTVVGVAPPGFRGTFTGFDIDAWVPVTMQPVAVPGAGSILQREDRFLMLLGRPRPGVSRDGAARALALDAGRLRLAQRDSAERVRLEVAGAAGVHPFVAQLVTAFLALLQGVVLLVLLIACVNLAGVLLVRASARRRELAVRAALGAGRWQLARPLLAESLAVAAAGGALGLVLAAWAGRALEAVRLPAGIPVGITLGVDARVALAALALTLAAAAACGAGPALAASRADALAELRAGGGGGGGATPDRRRSRARGVLVGAQVLAATVLLVGSGLLLRSLERSRALDLGFDPAGVQVVAASPELLGYDEARGRALWEEIAARAERVPGVRAATLALFVPLGARGDLLPMAPDPFPSPSPSPSPSLRSGSGSGSGQAPERIAYNIVRPGWFEVVRTPIVAGRALRPSDDARSPDVVVAGAALARRFFGGERDAVGRSIRIMDREGRARHAEIVGVARDIKTRSMGEPPRPLAYLPFGQWYRPDMVLHVRTGDGAAAGAATRRVVEQIHAAEPDLALEVEPMSRTIRFSLIPLQVAGAVLGFAGAAGLLLASLGVFGLVAYAVSLRTREIGIRMALGAGGAAVTRLVARQGLRPVAAGLALGLLAALGAARLLGALLVGVGPADPLTLAVVAAVLLASAAAAVVVPIRRAVRLDPAAVLRAE